MQDSIYAFIDGQNFHATANALGVQVDFRKLRSWLDRQGRLIQARYYTTIWSDDDGLSTIRPLVDWLDYNGYRVVCRPVKSYIQDDGRRKTKASMAVDLTADAMELADHADRILLFAGDGDYRALIRSLQRKGKVVTVVSTLVSQPPQVSDELRRQADHFLELDGILDEIARPREADTRRVAAGGH